VVRAVPDYTLGQVKTRLFRSQVDCNHVEVKGKEPDQVLVSKEDEELIKKIAASPDAYDRLVSSIAPVILGHQPEKEAILLLLAGGSATVLPDGTKLRGTSTPYSSATRGVWSQMRGWRSETGR